MKLQRIFCCLQQSLYWVQYRSTQQERSAIAAIASHRGHRLVRLVFGYVLAIPGAGLVLDAGPESLASVVDGLGSARQSWMPVLRFVVVSVCGEYFRELGSKDRAPPVPVARCMAS